MSTHVYVYGAGGHAKVVLAVLEALGLPVGGLFDDAIEAGAQVAGYPVLGAFDPAKLEYGSRLVLAIGSNAIRRQLAERLADEATWSEALIHPSAVVHRSVTLGAGSVVFAGAVLQPDTQVGQHTIVNTAATVDHDGRLGDYVHLAPGVHLAGDVHVGAGTFLGVGASVIPGRRIGAWSTVGAGSVVTRNVPDYVTAVGVPARTIKHRAAQ